MLPYAKVTSPSDLCFRMRGKEVFEFAVNRGSEVVAELLRECGLGPRDVDWIVPHQANINIVDQLARRLEIDRARFLVNLDRYGNTAGASVLIALDELLSSRRTRPGHTVVLVAFGGGLTWGASLIVL
jgi:3-oxoacyl-[acyl-carrier-protein] synthase-3